ncbi:MAG TPA: hypothetical protein VFG50_01095, partial [Rhodothermales bacterium]|nr:hypothetical protein [Rhodothermales bacterium]
GTPGGTDFQEGVGFADFIDNDGDGETGGPVVTQDMINAAAGDRWQRWPVAPENDPVQQGLDGRPLIHLVGLDADDLGKGFKDNIDNDDSYVTPTATHPYLSEPGSPVVTQEMIDGAASDAYRRYHLPGTDIILYDVGPEDLDKAYADGVDNDGDGAVDEGIDEGIDEMTDESRADGIDNDGDWRPIMDDTGLDGVAYSGDPGDSDGQPTTGAGTDFPGERNIDVTDVSESDQIGITNVQYRPAFFVNFNSQSDRFLFNTFMIPGDFYDPTTQLQGDYDLFVSSGLFPLKAGQTERISFSVQLGQDEEEALRSRDHALDAYAADYQFAQAPVSPTVTAVPGNDRVTLYWDAAAEESFDSFLADIGLPGKDFEGYRIYRATDPAFLDAKVITDGFGNLLLRKPIAQFDLIDGQEGFHPVDVNGVKFYLGNDHVDPGEADNGLAHVFVDTTVDNGVTYFYAVTAYDFGSTVANISPSETPIRIRRLPDGTIETGLNVVQVVPNAPVAGYANADVKDLNRTQGYTSSRIGYEIVDPMSIQDGHQYRVVFQDTLIAGDRNTPDTLTTKSFSLIDLTDETTVLDHSTAFRPGSEFPVFGDDGEPLGFKLRFFPDAFIMMNSSESGWREHDTTNAPLTLDPYLAAGFLKGFRNPADYRVEIVGPGEGRSTQYQVRSSVTLPARPTNVKVFNVSTGKEVKYAFWDLTGDDFVSPTSTEPATFSFDPSQAETDRIILIEPQIGDPDGGDIVTWMIGLNFTFEDRENPNQGDMADLVLRKPFLSSDEFEFTVAGPSVDEDSAKAQLDRIQVVPNPYVVTNRFETQSPFSTGRGPRVLRFINLPPRCTVRIYTVSGQLVKELRRDEGSNDPVTPAALMNGTLTWDLESEDALSVSYGVYLYHVEAPGIGEKSGTFAVIK